jgi:hypothetical protein
MEEDFPGVRAGVSWVEAALQREVASGKEKKGKVGGVKRVCADGLQRPMG